MWSNVGCSAQNSGSSPSASSSLSSSSKLSTSPTSPTTPLIEGPYTYCRVHDGAINRFYCETCYQPTCAECADLNHSGHRFSYLEDVSYSSRCAAEKYLNEANTNVLQLRNGIDGIEKVSQAIDARIIAVMKNIRTVFQRFHVALNKRERELLIKLEQAKTMKKKVLTQQSERLRGTMGKYTWVAECISEALDLGSPMEVIVAKHKATFEMRNLAGAPYNVAPYENATLNFVEPDMRILDLLADMGDIATSEFPISSLAVGEGIAKAVRHPLLNFEPKFPSDINNLLRDFSACSVEQNACAKPSTSNSLFLGHSLYNTPINSLALVDPRQQENRFKPRAVLPMNGLYSQRSQAEVQKEPCELNTVPRIRAIGSYGCIRLPTATFCSEGDGEAQLCRPWGVCCDNEGHIIVADRSNNRIQIFNSDGVFIKAFGTPGIGDGEFDRPAGVSVDKENRIIVTDKDNHRVQIFRFDGTFVLKFGEKGSKCGQFNYPWDVAVNSKNQIIISDTRNHRLQMFDSRGNFMRKYGFDVANVGVWKQFDSPRGVCFGPNDSIIVSDFNNHRIVVFDPTFDKIFFIGSEGTGPKQFLRPQGVVCDKIGNIIVADSRNHRIQVIKEDGSVMLCQFGSNGRECGEFDRPSGVAVNPEGNIVVVDFGNNRIQVF